MQPTVTDTSRWTAWSHAERQSFFDAIAHHRRAAWRVTLASRAGNLVVAIIVAVLMAPLFYGAICLALDLINLIVPVPNLVPGIGRALDKPLNSPATVGVRGWIQLIGFAALPGLFWMAFVLNALRRVLRMCVTLDPAELAARVPDTSVLAEQRFANVVAEMAIAANVPQPRVLIVNSDVLDAVAFGVDEEQASIVVSQGLLARLNRSQMEGVAADLIASIANGDLQIGLRTALSVTLFALVARLGSVVTQPHARRNVLQIVRATLLPTATTARKLVDNLASPFADDEKEKTAKVTPRPVQSGLKGNLRERWEKIRPYLWLPLGGPVVMTGFFGGIVNLFILGPLISLAWRQRKYMADATAIRLTRDPDTLAGALEEMSGCRGAPIAPWAAHMSIVSQGVKQRGLFGSSAVPMFPSIDRRMQALGVLGAHVSRAPGKMPLRLLIIILPLLVIVGALVAIMLPLLVWLSLASTALFGGVPFAIVHSLLRWMGHH